MIKDTSREAEKKIESEETINEISKRVMPDILAMAKSKSRFDIEKFLLGKAGVFIATQFHFLMIEYRTVIQATKEIVIDIAECNKNIEALETEEQSRHCHPTYSIYHRFILYVIAHKIRQQQPTYKTCTSLGIKRELCKRDFLKIALEDNMRMIGDLEEMRIAIIKNNDEKKITLDQYEEEQPAYQRWRLAVTAMNQVNSKMTGMSGGVIEAIQQGARKPIMKGSKMQIPPASTLQGGLCVEGVARDSLSENDVYLKEPPKNIWPQAACLR